MSEPITIINNETRQRFEIKLGDEFAYLEYRWHNNILVLMHTFVPAEGRGQNLASQLATHALNYARENNLKIKVYCSYVSQYMRKNPENNDLISRQDS